MDNHCAVRSNWFLAFITKVPAALYRWQWASGGMLTQDMVLSSLQKRCRELAIGTAKLNIGSFIVTFPVVLKQIIMSRIAGWCTDRADKSLRKRDQ